MPNCKALYLGGSPWMCIMYLPIVVHWQVAVYCFLYDSNTSRQVGLMSSSLIFLIIQYFTKPYAPCLCCIINTRSDIYIRNTHRYRFKIDNWLVSCNCNYCGFFGFVCSLLKVALAFVFAPALALALGFALFSGRSRSICFSLPFCGIHQARIT